LPLRTQCRRKALILKLVKLNGSGNNLPLQTQCRRKALILKLVKLNGSGNKVGRFTKG